MYLRRTSTSQGYHYLLRESYIHEGSWKHRDLVDLGADPGEYIEYPGGNGFYFNSELEDRLHTQGVEYTSEDLEALFLPFMKPHVRRIVEMFGGGERSLNTRQLGSDAEQMRRQSVLHVFDQRRLHYLRCGRVDIGRLDQRVWKFLNVLYDKSRDEIENLIEDMEQQLQSREIRPYLFTAFQLQSYFPHNPLRHQPATLDGERVDDYFLEEICRMNRDFSYFRGIVDHDARNLHPYLTRYVILYFDHDFDRHSLWNQYIEDFMQARRRYRPPQSRPAMADQEAYSVFELDEETVRQMSRRELIRLYRRRAKEIHPDTGGDHDAFIRLTEAFASLLAKKR